MGPVRERVVRSPGWRGEAWSHALLEAGPDGDKGLLWITGDCRPRDLEMAEALALRSGLPTAVLADVPNQPWNGLAEDALIAHSFERFLEAGDASWPILGPMTEAVPATLDELGWGRAVVAGCSKRGWTAWLAALSSDSRIAGIACLAFEALDMPAQMALQRSRFGGYSERIEDYSTPGLADLAGSPEAEPLLERVDPIRRLSRLSCPAHVIAGTADRFWPVDSHRVYWDRIPGQHLLSIIPNAPHDLESEPEAWAAVGFFARCCLGIESGGWPADPDPREIRRELWSGSAEGPDLRDALWGPGEPLGPWAASTELRWLAGDCGPALFSRPVEILSGP
jgi:pimeloyl-ACP methyl ester carboxylesterase